MLISTGGPDGLGIPFYCYAAWDWRTDAPMLPRGWPQPESHEAASPKRRAEFAAGRLCAARAIRLLDESRAETVGVNGDRSPRWPEGVVGSITHTDGFVAAAVARSGVVRGLGIDSEKIHDGEALAAVKSLAPTNREKNLISRLGLTEPEAYFLLFSAKESIYKCLNPIVRIPFDFPDVSLYEIDRERGSYRYRLNTDLGAGFPAGFASSGRFEFSGPFVHTATELPSPI